MDEEAHHIVGGEELIAHGEFTTVTRRVELAHLLAFLACVEELIRPAEGVIGVPEVGVLRSREERHNGLECRLRRAKREKRVAGVEQGRGIDGEFVRGLSEIGPVAARVIRCRQQRREVADPLAKAS